MSSGSLDNLDPQSAAYVAHIDTSAERCAAQDAQDTWTTAVRNISDYTAAYLSAGELEEIWNKVLSSPCYRKVDEEQRSWADLLTAIARRNAPDIVKFGTVLLGRHSANSPDDLAYLTTVIAAANVRMGNIEQARNILQTQWERLNHAGQFDFALRELSALTRAVGAPMIARAAR
jgi:hypothetical protein